MLGTGSRRPAGRVALFLGGVLLAVLAGVAAGTVGRGVAGPDAPGVGTTLVRLVLLVVGAVLAGTGLVRPLAGASGKAHGRVAGTAGALVGVVALAGYLDGDVDRTATLAWVLVAVAVPVLLAARPAVARWAALPGAGAAVLLVPTLGSAHAGAAFTADAVYAVATAVLLGALAAWALPVGAAEAAGSIGPAGSPSDGPAAAPGRPAPIDGTTTGAPIGDPALDPAGGRAVGPAGAAASPAPGTGRPLVLTGVAAAVLAVLAGLARILVAGPFAAADLLGTGYGVAALAALVLPAVVLAAGAALAWRDRAMGAAFPGVDPGIASSGRPAAGSSSGRAGAPRPWERPGETAGVRRIVAAVSAVAVAAGVGAAATAGLLPAPAPAAEPGRILLRSVALAGQDVPVLVTPMRPGPNLVQLGGTGYPTPDSPAAASAVAAAATPAGTEPAGHHMAGHAMPVAGGAATVDAGGDPVAFTSRPGARGGWALVDVPAGTSSLTVTMGGDTATVPVDVGTEDAPRTSALSAVAGRDGPECASAVVGAVLAGGPAAGTTDRCPSQTLDPGQARDLTAMVHTMAVKGARTARVVGDSSPRSTAAARLVRDEGTKAGLAFPPDAENDPNSALIVVSGWEPAVGTLDEAAQRARTIPTHLGGTFLAPWLLSADVMRHTASAFLPLTFGPIETAAQRYAISLSSTYPDTAASASGFLAFARTAGIPLDPAPSLYGAAAVDVPMSIEPPGSTGHHGGPDPASWYPGGTVVPVSGPMDAGVAR